MGWGENLFLRMDNGGGKRWAQKNHGAEEKTFLRKDVSMGWTIIRENVGLKK
jgi:hypothetical protein